MSAVFPRLVEAQPHSDRLEPADPRSMDLQRQIKAEQVELLFRHASLAQVTNLLVASACVGFLWSIAPHGPLLGWWSVIALLVAFRLGLLFCYRRRRADSRIPWERFMTNAAACSGIAWGAAGFFFFYPESPISLIVLTVTVAGLASGSIAAYSSWPPAVFGYISLAVTPICARYLLETGVLRAFGVVCLFYLFNVLAYARELSHTLINSIRLRIEKQELVKQLRVEMAAAQEAKVRAEDANLAKSRFLAAASHDLRQPLHAMNLFLEALRQENNPAAAHQVLAHLAATHQSLDGLLNELLDISKLEAGLFKPQRQAISLRKLFESLDQELWPIAEEKGVTLRFAATQAMIESDAGMLGRILRNIITNAIRYTEKGTVLVGCRRLGDSVGIAVYDTGPGIAPEHHQAIFREFYQLGNPERDRRKGLGLGLAIVDGLCRVLGHRVEIKSRLGSGTCFSVVVPRAPGAETAHVAAEEAMPCDLSGQAVLVIDDEPAICEAMGELLGRWGCRVLAAEGAKEAIERLARERFVPDTIIADYRLRAGRTGSEAIREVRHALGWEVPAAIITGDTSPERLREASASGFLLLHKPVQPGRLRAVLAELRG